jgi:CMP-N,N'-diacetyllegionaminic acid synthase
MENKNSVKNIAIIPARGGSKRIKDKNIVEFKGKPLIFWTIQAALNSNYISEVFVSTDSDDIKRISEDSGAKVYSLRPSNLSQDDTSTEDVLKYELKKYSNFNNFILLQPSSPLRTSTHIDEAFELYEKEQADSLVSISELKSKTDWLYTLVYKTTQKLKLDSDIQKETLFSLNGAIYIRSLVDFMQTGELINAKTIGYIMENASSVDIDTADDLEFARFLVSKGF